MLDLIDPLPAHSRILDLGAGPGSFHTDRGDLLVIRVDLEIPAAKRSGQYVRADAALMPLANRSLDLIVSNHSLEHFSELEQTVREMGRTIKTDGVLFVAVPDATTLTDRLYRWLGRGGGHVNPFRSPEEVVCLIERLTGLRHRGTCALYSSLCFLNAHNLGERRQKKMALFAFGNERFLAGLTWTLRWLDLRLGTRLSHYGWSFYFGSIERPVEEESWVNVCVRCGAGHSEAFLRKQSSPRRAGFFFETYRCPACGGFNLMTRDR